jgi:hypothetical protein
MPLLQLLHRHLDQLANLHGVSLPAYSLTAPHGCHERLYLQSAIMAPASKPTELEATVPTVTFFTVKLIAAATFHSAPECPRPSDEDGIVLPVQHHAGSSSLLFPATSSRTVGRDVSRAEKISSSSLG